MYNNTTSPLSFSCGSLIYVITRKCCCILYFCLCIPVSVRDLGMVPYIKIFLDVDQYRGPTLGILEQLAEINPEEFMSTAIGALCSSTRQELGLKRDLLQVAAYYTSYMTSQSLSVAHVHQKNTQICSDFSWTVNVFCALHQIITNCNVLKIL